MLKGVPDGTLRVTVVGSAGGGGAEVRERSSGTVFAAR
jgi:hypothetical protein